MSYTCCTLCAHTCRVNRQAGERGRCGMTAVPVVARAALHFWEEPVISGTRGSGTVFFSGCSLGCIYCQNAPISHGGGGKALTPQRLTEIYLELQTAGAHNINLVTPTHYVPTIRQTVMTARTQGLTVPIVYNTASFETLPTLRAMEGIADIYLADLKYLTSAVAARYSHAPIYPTVAMAAVAEMVRQCPAPELSTDGLLRRGVIVRVLLLPGHVAEAKRVVGYLYHTYGDAVYISLMNQYTPPAGMPAPLDRPVTRAEYRDLCDYADRIGVRRAFVQEGGTAAESFIPAFDGEGV